MRPLSTGLPASSSSMPGKKLLSQPESPKAHLVSTLLPMSTPKCCSETSAQLCRLRPTPRPPGPGSCTTHLPAIPKGSLRGLEQPLRALQIILGKAIEVPTEPTDLAPVGARHSHLHLGLPIPQHLCGEAGTGERGNTSPRSALAAHTVSARPPLSEGGSPWGRRPWPRPPGSGCGTMTASTAPRKAPAVRIPELGPQVKCTHFQR